MSLSCMNFLCCHCPLRLPFRRTETSAPSVEPAPSVEHAPSVEPADENALSNVGEDEIALDIPPPDAQPADASVSSDYESSQSEPIPPSTMSKTTRFVVFFALISVFVVSMVFSVRSWIIYERKLSDVTWEKEPCKVVPGSVKSEKSGKIDNMYRVKAMVSGNGAGILLSSPQQAFSSANGEYKLSKANAKMFVEKWEIPEYKYCYVRKLDPAKISLQSENVTDEEKNEYNNSLYVGWTMTFVAAVVGMVIVGFGSHWTHAFLSSVEATRREREGGVEKVRVYLTVEQSRFVCDSGEEIIKGQDVGNMDWGCSVCLDEDGGEEDVRTVVLPCEHRFHRECIKRWLRRGRAQCPLCHWDAKTLFDASGAPKTSAVEDNGVREGEDGVDEVIGIVEQTAEEV